MTADNFQVDSDMTPLLWLCHVQCARVYWQNCFGDKRGCPYGQTKCSEDSYLVVIDDFWLSWTTRQPLALGDLVYYEPCFGIQHVHCSVTVMRPTGTATATATGALPVFSIGPWQLVNGGRDRLTMLTIICMIWGALKTKKAIINWLTLK